MARWLTLTLLVTLAAGLSGCYVVSPYHPAYPPAPPAPAYVPPPAGGSAPAAPPPAAGPGTATPGAPAGAGTKCETVRIEGHYETRVLPDGRRETVWIPDHQQQRCQ